MLFRDEGPMHYRKPRHAEIFCGFIAVIFLITKPSAAAAAGPTSPGNEQGQPVQVATVENRQVSEQISLIGTTAAVAESTVAAEIPGIVEQYPIKEGDFVKKGQLLAKLRTTYLNLRLKGARAARERVLANLKNAEKELARVSKLRDTNSVAEKAYDEALYAHRGLIQELLQNEAEIEQLVYEISQTTITAPFSGHVAHEHTQIGQWLATGSPVVTLIDLGQVLVTVDVPERYAVKLQPQGSADVAIRSLSEEMLIGNPYVILPEGNPAARTIPVKVQVNNPKFEIRSGMEARVTFSLGDLRIALLVPKDAIVTSGNNRSVFTLLDGKAQPVAVIVKGYYGGDVAVEGHLKPGDRVVIRGNERLRPGQAVIVQNP